MAVSAKNPIKRVIDDIGLLALITMFNLTNLEKCSIDISDKTRKQMESISVSTDRFSDPWTRWFKLPRFIFRRNFQLSFSVIWLKYYIRKELLTRNRTLESMVCHFCWMLQQYLSKNSMGWSQKFPSNVREPLLYFPFSEYIPLAPTYHEIANFKTKIVMHTPEISHEFNCNESTSSESTSSTESSSGILA